MNDLYVFGPVPLLLGESAIEQFLCDQLIPPTDHNRKLCARSIHPTLNYLHAHEYALPPLLQPLDRLVETGPLTIKTKEHLGNDAFLVDQVHGRGAR